VDLETHFRETHGPEAVRALSALRDKIAQSLTEAGLLVIPEEEARKPVPWLQAGEDVWVGEAFTGQPITVKDAFFFHMS
jgi:hypothetical protein